MSLSESERAAGFRSLEHERQSAELQERDELEPAGVTMASFDGGHGGYSREAGKNLRRRALGAISELPGVQSAADANSRPLNIDQSGTVVYPGDRPDLQRSEVLERSTKSPRILSDARYSLAARPRRGLARQLDELPCGRRQRGVCAPNPSDVGRTRTTFPVWVSSQSIEVVGVVETGMYQSLTEAETPVVFEPILQAYNTTPVILVRSSWPTGEMAAEIRRVIKSLDPPMPLVGVRAIQEMLGFVLLPMRVAQLRSARLAHLQ